MICVNPVFSSIHRALSTEMSIDNIIHYNTYMKKRASQNVNKGNIGRNLHVLNPLSWFIISFHTRPKTDVHKVNTCDIHKIK